MSHLDFCKINKPKDKLIYSVIFSPYLFHLEISNWQLLMLSPYFFFLTLLHHNLNSFANNNSPEQTMKQIKLLTWFKEYLHAPPIESQYWVI